ncbi:MAG: peptidylprolyl isomerase [Acidobacteriia bacterium]|nr:peptidylprolyl isomerase [Terriglobia bacterium]
MFDLFRSRDKAVRILLGVLLGLVGLSMLTYLVPNYNNGTTSASDQVVAEVAKEPITLVEIQNTIQNTMRNRQVPAEILPNYIPQMVQDLVTERALAYEAQRLGFEATDQDVRNTIRQMVPSLFPDGNFVGKDAYAAMLAQQNLSIPQFEADLRRQILITRLRNIAVEGTVVTPAEIEQEFKKKFEKVKVEWVELKSDMYSKESQPSETDIRNYYNANKASYQVPEKKSLAILIGDEAKLEAAYAPTDAQLQALYNQNRDQYRSPETVDVRHILLKTTGKPDEDAKVKAKAEDVLKQARSGADFAELAKKYSEDTGSAQSGGLYKGVTRGQMVPEFEQAAFSLKQGQISDLVKTQYGYHIVMPIKHDEAHLKTFDEVKDQLAAQFKKQHATDQMQQIADKAQAALQKDPAHPDKVAADLNMQLVRADAGTNVAEIGSSQDFEQSIAGLKKGEVSAPVALPNNKIALAVVTDIVPSRPSTFEEAESKIKDTITNNRSAQAVQTHAQDLIKKTQEMGGDLEKAAKSMGLTMKTTGEVERTGSVEGLGSAQYLTDAFAKPNGSVFGPVNMPTGTLVGKVVEHIAADPAKLADQRATIRDQIKSEKARDRDTLFEAGLRDDLIKRGVIKIHQNVINSLVAQYQKS